jgi:AbrB family looped-hinge helix DNA binding protein
MIATVTSKGQITIPLAVRTRLNLKAGDQIEFDESASVLTARRVIDREQWKKAFAEWGDSVNKSLGGHPWQKMSSSELLDDMRGEVEENIPLP